MDNRKHRWIKDGEFWFIYCVDKGDKFSTQLWFNKPEMQGLCPFCGRDAKQELDRAKKIKLERQRQSQMKEEMLKKNTLEGWL